MKRPYLFLLFVILIASILRFWHLGINPPSLTWDEVAWGYNAYALGSDGKDEFGRFLPYDYLESFGDFKPPIYAYLDILPIKIFGLTAFAVRFPSAVFGVLTVLITFFLTQKIFYSLNTAEKGTIGLLASFLLAISPWHINLSRAAFEANVATFFVVTGIWLFLGGTQGKRWWLSGAAVCFVLSMYTFNTPRIVSPLLVLALCGGFLTFIFKRKREVTIAGIIGLLLLLPSISFLLSPQASLRFREVNIFSDISVIERTNQEITNDRNVWWSKIIHNRRLVYGVEYLHHYFDNLTPKFLFISGDGNPKFSTQDIGQMYLWEIPFLIAGVLLLFKKKTGNWWVIPLWCIIAIIPAATARETPHALRIETILPAPQILVAFGIYSLFSLIKKQRLIITRALLAVVVFLSSLYYLHGYYVHYSREFSGEWQYGYEEAINYTESVKSAYDAIHITTALGRPYIYMLFYTKTPPENFRKSAIVQRDAFGFVTVESVGKYSFAKNVHDKTKNNEKILYINTPGEVPPGANKLQTFYLLNGNPSLIAYTL